MTFAMFLREKRTERQLSKKSLSDSLDVSRFTISKWESGADYPCEEIIPTLASVLNVDIARLYTELAASKAEETPLRRLINLLCLCLVPLALVGGALVVGAILCYCLLNDAEGKAKTLLVSLATTILLSLLTYILFSLLRKNEYITHYRRDLTVVVYLAAILAAFVFACLYFAFHLRTSYPYVLPESFFILLSILYSQKVR